MTLSGNEEQDGEQMRATAPGPIDCLMDILPPSAGTKPVQAGIRTVQQYGRVVLIGGVRNAG